MGSEPKPRGGGIDWVQVRARLEQAKISLEAALDPPPERAKAIMDARARVLAQPLLRPAPGSRAEVVAFGLGRERYAIESRFLREVGRATEITRLPGTPEFFVGLTNLRGTVLLVVDLRPLLGATVAAAVTDASRIVVLGVDRPEFGLLVDQLYGHSELSSDDIGVVAGSTPASSPLVRGVTRDALVVLDGAALLQDHRLIIDQGATATPQGG